MEPVAHTPASRTRAAYADAVASFLAVVDGIAPDQWGRPAIGDWTIRELVAHTSRALITVETYLDAPAASVDLTSSAAYFTAALDQPGIHAEVAGRARAQADALGPDPATDLSVLAGRVLARVEATPDDAVLGTFVGGITLVDYLPSRVVELVVHTLDLTDALGLPPVVGPTALAVTLGTLARVAADRPATADPVALVRAMAGRAPLPGGYNVLG
jgi:uncharacterized protein (TIGR03083 family)